jgi:hypothetical protein
LTNVSRSRFWDRPEPEYLLVKGTRREIALLPLLRVRLCCRDPFQLSNNVQKFSAARLLA